jgi:uncharacterized protein
LAKEDSPFWEKPLASLNDIEWEALCDGCGKCCLHKAEDEDTGNIYFTNIRCRLLDGATARCGDYPNRRFHVPDCVRLTPEKIAEIIWLPQSCAYKVRAEGKPLPPWHYLISGDRMMVQAQGHGIAGWTVAEDEAGDLEDHLVDREI